jgi:hypothetical protein
MKMNIVAISLLTIATTSCFTTETSKWVADIDLKTPVKVGETNSVTLSYKVPDKLTAPTALGLSREQLVGGAYKIYAFVCTTCGFQGEAYYAFPDSPAGTGDPAKNPIFPEVEFTEPPMLPQRLPVLIEATYNTNTQILSANFKYKAVSVPTGFQNGYTMLGGGFFYLPVGTSTLEYQKARWFAGSSQTKVTIVP